MGYFPGTQPGGGAGFNNTWSYFGRAYGGFSGDLISITLAADAVCVHFRIYTVTGGAQYTANKIEIQQGEALIDCSDHSFKVITAGARQGLAAPLERVDSESKILLGNTPGVLINIPEHQANIRTYTGPGNPIIVAASSIPETNIRLHLIVHMTVFRN